MNNQRPQPLPFKQPILPTIKEMKVTSASHNISIIKEKAIKIDNSSLELYSDMEIDVGDLKDTVFSIISTDSGLDGVTVSLVQTLLADDVPRSIVNEFFLFNTNLIKMKGGHKKAAQCSLKNLLRKVFKNYHGNSSKINGNLSIEQNIFHCDQCDFTCYHQSDFQHHCSAHVEPKFKCEICGTGFTTKGNLNRHMKDIHSSIKPYSCYFCTMEFSRRDALISHLKKHSNIRPFRCSFCPSSYKTKKALQEHELKCEWKGNDAANAFNFGSFYSSLSKSSSTPSIFDTYSLPNLTTALAPTPKLSERTYSIENLSLVTLFERQGKKVGLKRCSSLGIDNTIGAKIIKR